MKTVIHFLLDETGSMSSCREETIKGFNKYIDKLREQDIDITVTKFNSDKVEVVCNNVGIDTVPKLSPKNYVPSSCTPLFDAIADSIGRTEEILTKFRKNVRILFVILTDGLENDSKRYTRTQVLDMIKSKEKKGWTIVYMGANQDAYAESGAIGVYYNNAVNFNTAKMGATFSNLVACTQSFTAGEDKSTEDFFKEWKTDNN